MVFLRRFSFENMFHLSTHRSCGFLLKEFKVSICRILIVLFSRIIYVCELTIPLKTCALLLFFLFKMMICVKVKVDGAIDRHAH